MFFTKDQARLSIDIMNEGKRIFWQRADYGVCWKGAYTDRISFTVIQSRENSYILQVPISLSKGKYQENITCRSLTEAQEMAEHCLEPEMKLSV